MLLRTGSRRRLRLVPPAEKPCQDAKHAFGMWDAGAAERFEVLAEAVSSESPVFMRAAGRPV
jgi:hypothetical protein